MPEVCAPSTIASSYCATASPTLVVHVEDDLFMLSADGM
jgi:hypothetical protein